MFTSAPRAEGRHGVWLRVGDPLRAVAMLSIVSYHVAVGAMFLRAGTADPQAVFGRVGGVLVGDLQYGVYLFFALSGFLIGRPWIAAAAGRSSWPSVGVYVARRLGRVVPAFWVACGLVLLIYGPQGSSGGQVAAMFAFAQVYNLGAVAGPLGHAWSLDAELLFYAVVPLAAMLAVWLSHRAPRTVPRAAMRLG